MSDLSELSNEELIAKYNEAKHLKTVYATSQLVKKILLNSYYGATGSPYFRYYDKRLAQATTLTGQCLIKTTANNISKFIQKVVKDKSVKPLVYGDTDSCGPDTVLNLQMNNIDSNITIEDYYNIVSGDYCKYDEKNQQFVKLVTSNDKILTVNDNQLVYTPIKYVMKHRVKKHMYKLKIHNESITITEDHSLMVERDGKLVKVKPGELQKTDHILYLFDK